MLKHKRLVVLLLSVVLVLGALLAGCSSQSKTATTSQGQSEQVLNLNLGEEPPTLDPQKATDEVSITVLNAVLEGLVRYNKDGKIEKGSGLAKDWKISDDGLTYTFYLKDAKWSDGNPITAYDFEYAWKRALDPKTGSQYAYQLYYIKGAEEYNSGKGSADQVGIKALDDKTLQVTLKAPAPQFLGLTSFVTYLPLEKSVYEKYGDKVGSDPSTMVFSGPFIIKEWNHEQNIVLEKNPNYWDKDNVKLDKINFSMIKDNNSLVQNYDTGALDSIFIPGDYIDKYKDSPEFHTYALATVWYLQFNNKDKIFKNANIRKAFTLAVNRELFVKEVMKNGSIPAEAVVPPGIPGYNGDFRSEAGPGYFKDNDVAQAKEYLQKGLQELGLSKLPTIKFLTGDSDTAKKYSVALQQMWNQALGVQVEIQNVAFKVRLDMMDRGDYQIVLAGWGADYNDPMTFLDMWETNNGNNTAFYSNPEYDKLIEQAKVNGDPKSRVEEMIQAEKILMEDMPIGPLWFQARAYVVKPYVKNLYFPAFGPDWEMKWTYIEGKK
ncbi:oligopeptide transport system substrate-binding protein [Caldanaerobacter subterraneus subsp. tengcongensis MB4]|uniref:ABC-type dipeptide/oligopeptide/nickel transport systems, periplasmic components n=1 Tax=Caldanaerobacter subterraneus subsp. tengcongensis (strain DSM 15242 / JCM 11007 / NBRC 100824 / MB4) TaxID=273068 RepID=Q8RC37_CALS4|nr:peptide ABC transporter substrate-binding protein [Caldanaerobacter subterraneus]AAM23881.1 ABC-type dipeptide/oligopeptide/nickel transport systems, periplasmic components [Caldanaerobacter subterraneus subsp. tengcongensis MB4]MCS3916615.1 oligopeptide transport system substrate-binding protein [Caldanaerobacter subterraneus subsp. tengcongensis MB4]